MPDNHIKSIQETLRFKRIMRMTGEDPIKISGNGEEKASRKYIEGLIKAYKDSNGKEPIDVEYFWRVFKLPVARALSANR